MQGGDDHVGTWHVYANPLNPFIFSLLALSRYFLTFTETLKTNAAVFQGMPQYNRYLIAFLKFVADHKVELQKLGVQHGDIGNHSCRKGVGTMVSAGCTIAPPIILICIRCGWVMGEVKDKYLKYKAAGDQYVGRRDLGLNQLRKEFTVTTAYFDFFGEINDEVDPT